MLTSVHLYLLPFASSLAAYALLFRQIVDTAFSGEKKHFEETHEVCASHGLSCGPGSCVGRNLKAYRAMSTSVSVFHDRVGYLFALALCNRFFCTVNLTSEIKSMPFTQINYIINIIVMFK